MAFAGLAVAMFGYTTGAFGGEPEPSGGPVLRVPAGGPFLRADARQFTLLHASSTISAATVMPDGDVLVARDDGNSATHLWRLGLDGRYAEIGSLPNRVIDVVAETPTTILTLPDGGDVTNDPRPAVIERYNLATKERSVVGEVSLEPGDSDLERIVALDDGSIVVTDGACAWRVRPDGVIRLPYYRNPDHWLGEINPIGSLAALPGGAFAYADSRRSAIVRVGADGKRQNLVRVDRNTFPELASAGEELVAVLNTRGDVEGPRAQIIRMSGSRVQQVLTRPSGQPVYGNGDGYGPKSLKFHRPRALLAGDGSLLILDDIQQGTRLRALVPRASPRLRIALRPSFWRTFARGRVDYTASTPGQLDLRIRRAGRRGDVAHLNVATSAGAGTLHLVRALPPARYYMRLTLSTSRASTTAAARIFTSTNLSVSAARQALGRAFTSGDEGDDGTDVTHRCVRRDRSRVACRRVAYRAGDGPPRLCPGWVVAQLFADEIRVMGGACDYDKLG